MSRQRAHQFFRASLSYAAQADQLAAQVRMAGGVPFVPGGDRGYGNEWAHPPADAVAVHGQRGPSGRIGPQTPAFQKLSRSMWV
jgi:hypothetical protein